MGLLNWNIVEANVTILCASLIASKPVAMLLVPDRLISRISLLISRSFRSQRIKLVTKTQVGPNKDPYGSQSHIQNGQSSELEGIANSMQRRDVTASQAATDELPLEDLPQINIPQPARTHNHTQVID